MSQNPEETFYNISNQPIEAQVSHVRTCFNLEAASSASSGSVAEFTSSASVNMRSDVSNSLEEGQPMPETYDKETIDAKLEAVEHRLESKLTRIEAAVQVLSGRVDALVGRMDAQYDSLVNRMDSLESSVNFKLTLLSILMGAVFALVAWQTSVFTAQNQHQLSTFEARTQTQLDAFGARTEAIKDQVEALKMRQDYQPNPARK